MKKWLAIMGAVACTFLGNGANAKQSGTLPRSGEAIGQFRANPSFDTFGFKNSRAPATVVGSSTDIFVGTSFVGRDPDRNIRLQILRDTTRF